MRILLVDRDADRAASVAAGLAADGCTVAAVIADTADLVEAVRRHRAEVIVCDIDAPSRDALESMRALYRDEPRPVVMFVDRSEPDSIVEAMEAGVAAYVIEGLAPHRVRSVVDVAVARFNAHQSMRAELAEARQELADRKLVEHAKALLMTTRGLSEKEAYRRLRRLAMDQGRRLRDIAAAIVADEHMPAGEGTIGARNVGQSPPAR